MRIAFKYGLNIARPLRPGTTPALFDAREIVRKYQLFQIQNTRNDSVRNSEHYPRNETVTQRPKTEENTIIHGPRDNRPSLAFNKIHRYDTANSITIERVEHQYRANLAAVIRTQIRGRRLLNQFPRRNPRDSESMSLLAGRMIAAEDSGQPRLSDSRSDNRFGRRTGSRPAN